MKPEFKARVQLGRQTAVVEKCGDIVRLRLEGIPNFYSRSELTPLEIKDILKARRRAIHELLEARFGHHT